MSTSPDAQLSPARKVGFTVLAALAAIVLIEAVAAAFLSISEGSWANLDAVAARRDALLEMEASNDPSALDSDRLEGPEALHPYIGFAKVPRPAAEADPAVTAWSESAPAFEERLVFEPSDERVVIAVLGGSVADIVAAGGSGLAIELRKLDRFEGREIRVISLAQGGFKQPQQVTLLAYLLALGAHFDLVLNIDGFNEVALPAIELVPRDVFPFYPRAWDQRVGPLDSEPRRVAADLETLRSQRRGLARGFSAWPWRASYTAAVIWHALDRRQGQEIATQEATLLRTRIEDVTYGSHGPRRPYGSDEEMYGDFADFWLRSSLQLHHLCGGQGIEYRHFLQPNQYMPDSKPLAAERDAGTWLAEHPYRLAVVGGYPHLIRAGRELLARGVAFTDLTTIFAEREELLYSDSCCHLNFLGNTLLQRTIAHHLADGDFGRPENLSDGRLALEGYDPVSYFDRQPARGSAEITASHDGIRYRFTNSANRARFLADTGRYQPRFGGWCAFGMGVDETEMQVARERYPVDPESYEIYRDELYLFYRSPFIDGRELWRRHPERYRRRAEETWERLSGSGH